jgi:hypothetical protein
MALGRPARASPASCRLLVRRAPVPIRQSAGACRGIATSSVRLTHSAPRQPACCVAHPCAQKDAPWSLSRSARAPPRVPRGQVGPLNRVFNRGGDHAPSLGRRGRPYRRLLGGRPGNHPRPVMSPPTCFSLARACRSSTLSGSTSVPGAVPRGRRARPRRDPARNSPWE